MKFLKILAVIFAALAVVYLLGPRPATPVYSTNLPNVQVGLQQLDSTIFANESLLHTKPNNNAKIVWNNDSVPAQTKYAILYLHGFSASRQEGFPTHINIAKKFGCNLFLSRLSQHGIDTTEELIGLTAENYWQSAKEAFAYAKLLGKKLIIMGTSTGGTQALQLAAAYPNDVAALVLLSPNIAINDPNAWLLNNPWGLQIARLVKGGNYNEVDNCKMEEYKKYWNCKYRLEAVVALEEMLETTMIPETFAKINVPTLTLGYYKNEAQQDKVVKISAMQNMMKLLATDTLQKKLVLLPNGGNHVLGNPLLGKDVEGVEREITTFLQQLEGLKL
jgi:esterase/lipase